MIIVNFYPVAELCLLKMKGFFISILVEDEQQKKKDIEECFGFNIDDD